VQNVIGLGRSGGFEEQLQHSFPLGCQFTSATGAKLLGLLKQVGKLGWHAAEMRGCYAFSLTAKSGDRKIPRRHVRLRCNGCALARVKAA